MRRPIPAIPMPLGWGDVWSACTMGPDALHDFEEACRKYHGARRAFALSSARVGICVALNVLKDLFPNRNQVVLPAYTCPTVGRAVMAAGLTGICADVSLRDFNLSVADAAKLADRHTLAVIAPHMFGTPADLGRLVEVCRASGAALLEDVAQACGARFHGRLVGTFGELAVFSLGRSKNLRGYEGGVLLVNAPELVEPVARHVERLPEARPLRLGAIGKQLVISTLSTPVLWNMAKRVPMLRVGAEDQRFDPRPSRLSAWQAGLGLRALKRVEEYNAIRARLGHTMEQELGGVQGVHLQEKAPDTQSAYVRLATRLQGPRASRDVTEASLQGRGIDARAFYTRPMYGYAWWEGAQDQPACPHAEQLIETNLTLPLYHAMSDADARAVATEVTLACCQVGAVTAADSTSGSASCP